MRANRLLLERDRTVPNRAALNVGLDLSITDVVEELEFKPQRAGLTAHVRPSAFEPHEVIEFQEVGATSQTVIEAAGSKLFMCSDAAFVVEDRARLCGTATPSSVQSTFGRPVTAGACARFAQLG